MLLDDLKQQTRAQHRQLEQLNGLPGSRRSYLAQLESFYGFIAPWEVELAAHVPKHDVTRRGRGKTTWLVHDLRHFGYSDEAVAALPRCTELPSTATRAEILGACYVVEGSTLGGQFISRHLESALGLSGGGGYRYFRSYGADVPARWQSFREELLRHSSPENDRAMIAAAGATFEKLAQWFVARRLVQA
jgi:heme oxygenase (biliverdin-IX-beta and delta-forming)